MLTKIANLARRYASGRNVLVFFALQMIISMLILPYIQTRFDPDQKLGVLDLKFGFTPDQAYAMLDGYQEQGRKYYLFVEAFVDIIYPIIYTITNLLLLSYVFKRGFTADSFMQKLNVFPLLVIICDLLENAGIITMLTAFPNRADAAAALASNAGIAKWITFGIAIALFLTGIGAWIRAAYLNQKHGG
ncbi:hypothetical protein [Emticicia sp. 17c]|uniref:hypothetical protein n=1 Tax=Emticicia sp. 17c TaxID=3127704 RepID=UPI00301E474B